MPGARYNYIPKANWGWLGPAWKGIDTDLTEIESKGVQATGNIDASQITTGVVAPARLGSGTADATTILYGDGTWKTAPSGTNASTAWADITGKPAFAPVATSGAYADLTGRPDLTVYAPKASPTFTGTVTFTGATVTGLTKSTVGLGNVDNTADANKTFAASQITSGTVATARLGTGTASASTVLYGDGTWKAAPAGGGTTGDVAPANLQTSLGLSAGSGTTTTYAYALAGVSQTWTDATDTVPYTIGTRWTAGANGTVAAVRFQLTTRQFDGKAVTVGLYSDTGTLLGSGSKTISASDALGWVSVNLSSPVSVTSGTAYMAAQHVPLANDASAHFAKLDWGWDTYTSTGYVQSSKAGGNGWTQWNTASITFPTSADNTYFNMYGVDPILSVQEAAASGARMPVVAYYDDSNAATVARPTSDPLACVLWFNTTGTQMPAAAVANIDKVWTA